MRTVTRRQKSPEQLRRTSENYPDRHGRAKKAKEGSIRHDRGKSRAVVSEFRSLFGDIAPSMPAGSRPFVNPGTGEAGAGGVGYMRARTLHLLAVAADD
jgi:hypothetical protein